MGRTDWVNPFVAMSLRFSPCYGGVREVHIFIAFKSRWGNLFYLLVVMSVLTGSPLPRSVPVVCSALLPVFPLIIFELFHKGIRILLRLSDSS